MATITTKIGVLQPNNTYPITMTEDSGQVTNGSQAALPSVPGLPNGIQGEILDDKKPSGDQYRQIGAALFDWLFPEPLLARWRARVGEQPLLQLEIAPQELADLPWELLYDSVTKLYLSFTGGVVRIATSAVPQRDCSEWPLRILLVNAASIADEGPLGTKEEMEAIRRAFLPLGRSVDVLPLERPEREDLIRWLEDFQPHVFHFSGHARAIAGTPKTVLMMETAPKPPKPPKPWTWDATDIPNDLKTTHWTPNLVFLNACRTAASRGPVGTISEAFIASGTTAVIATQANVRGDRAAVFAVGLYDALAKGKDLVTATAGARRALLNPPGGYDHKAWALPVLTVNQAGMAAHSPRFGNTPWPKSIEYEQCREFEEARYFAGLDRNRRDLTQWFFPVRKAKDTPNVLLVSGSTLCGKSHLVKWCLENYVLGRARIRYVDAREGGQKDFLGMLRQIRDGEASRTRDSGRLLHEQLPQAAFRRFNWELNSLLGPKGVKPEWNEADHPPAELIPDQLLPLSDGRPENVIIDIFNEYLAALREVATTAPLVLALDQFRGDEGERLVSAADLALLSRYLFRPIAEAHTRTIKLVLVLDDIATNEVRKLLPKDRFTSVTVDQDFSLDELVRHVLEIFRYPPGEIGTLLETVARGSLLLPSTLPHRGLAKLQRFRENAENGQLGLPVERMR